MQQDQALLTLAEALREDAASATDDVRTLLWAAGDTGPFEDATELWSWDRRSHAHGCKIGLQPAPTTQPGRLAIRIPGAKAAQDLMFAGAAALLEEGTELWVTGGQRDGVKTVSKRLKTMGFEGAETRRIKRRTRVVVARRDASARVVPDLDALEARFEVTMGTKSATCVSLPSVFAHGHLDPGSALLLQTLFTQRPTANKVVDLGSGCGVLGVAMAVHKPKAHVTLVDAHSVAAEASRRTIAANDLESRMAVAQLTAGEAAGALGQRHDLVISNAPFHDGHDTDRTLMTQFAEGAKALLKPGGRLFLVSNHHLPYAALLEEVFGRCQKVAGDGRYNVFLVRG